jgi:hypothetical protein
MPEVPWRAIAGFRDFVAHVYFALDDAIVWGAVQNEVPKLRATVSRFLVGTQTAHSTHRDRWVQGIVITSTMPMVISSIGAERRGRWLRRSELSPFVVRGPSS